MSLLDNLKTIDKELDVKDAHTTGNERTREYVNIQIEEMKAVLTRLRVDILLNKEIAVEGDKERDGRDQKIRELSRDVKQFVQSITVLQKLSDDLTK